MKIGVAGVNVLWSVGGHSSRELCGICLNNGTFPGIFFLSPSTNVMGEKVRIGDPVQLCRLLFFSEISRLGHLLKGVAESVTLDLDLLLLRK